MTERERVCVRFSAEGPCAAGTLSEQSKQLNLGFICSSSIHACTYTQRHTQTLQTELRQKDGGVRKAGRKQGKKGTLVVCCGDDASSLEGQVKLEFVAYCTWSICYLLFLSFLLFRSSFYEGILRAWHYWLIATKGRFITTGQSIKSTHKSIKTDM